MTTSNRQKWEELLPIIQAFVNHQPIQYLAYGGRWEDTNSMTSLLHTQYRIKPGNLVSGIWRIAYSQQLGGNRDGVVAKGVMRWLGTNLDTPPWPADSDITYDESSEWFEPNVANGWDRKRKESTFK